MAVIKKNTLNRFKNNLKKYNQKLNSNEITETIGDIAISVTREEYSISGVTPNDIRQEMNGTSVEIIAVGEQLPFSEFGTGLIGEGSYQGELPSQSMKLRFESPTGVQQSTDGWVYNYRKKQEQTSKDWTGSPAKAQMFNTSVRLQNELGEQINTKIKGR